MQIEYWPPLSSKVEGEPVKKRKRYEKKKQEKGEEKRIKLITYFQVKKIDSTVHVCYNLPMVCIWQRHTTHPTRSVIQGMNWR